MIVSGIMESELSNITDVWVFGYGSILWNPGFDYVSSCVGYVEGYSRRFYQGSVFHRGTPDKPGRVATLIQHTGCKAWGMAFHVVGKSMVENCLEHLGVRECHIGGYQLQSLQFIQHGSTSSSDVTADQFCLPVWAFIAVPGNQLYLGPATIEQQAKQVCECRGVSGCNTEYVTRLADFLRDKIPQDNDSELFQLDRRVREIQQQQQQQHQQHHHHHHHHHTVDSHVTFNDISKTTNSRLSSNAMATVAPTISVRAC